MSHSSRGSHKKIGPSVDEGTGVLDPQTDYLKFFSKTFLRRNWYILRTESDCSLIHPRTHGAGVRTQHNDGGRGSPGGYFDNFQRAHLTGYGGLEIPRDKFQHHSNEVTGVAMLRDAGPTVGPKFFL